VLLDKYSNEGPERCGFIVAGEVIEVPNICAQPAEGFQMRGEDILRYAEHAEAMWHTHPGAPSNLSVDDYTAFLNWPGLLHYVVGSDGVRCFKVVKGAVLEA
jgi:proteasome lid subunit RPN8/RPN11